VNRVSDPSVFPLHDPVGPADASVVLPNSSVIADVVAPGAAAADEAGVLRSTIDALASAGLFGRPLPRAAEQRELAEVLSGSDGSTWFCWAQHYWPLRILEANAASNGLLPGLRAGTTMAAVAFAHVRRPGPPNPVATRVPGGWRLDGTLDWVTSWDIADVVMVMAQGAGRDEDSLVCCCVPAGNATEPTRGLEPGEPLRLLAMGGTHTRPLTLTSVHVADADCVVVSRQEWRARDARTSADTSPAVFGVARGALAELTLLAEQRSDVIMREVGSALADELRELRSRAYAAIDDESTEVTVRLGLRAQSLDVAVRAVNSVVIARAGAAMLSGQSSGRRAREALFLQVQAQTAAGRVAAFEQLASRAP